MGSSLILSNKQNLAINELEARGRKSIQTPTLAL